MATQAMDKDQARELIELMKRNAHREAYDLPMSGWANRYKISEEAVEKMFSHVKSAKDSVATDQLLAQFERSNMTTLEAFEHNASRFKSGAGKVMQATGVEKAWGGIKGAGKWAGIAGAVGAGALILSAALGSKRQASEEKLANEPPEAPAPMNVGFDAPAPMVAQQQPVYPMTGSTPPVEAEWVQRTGRGGQMDRTAIPSTPDVAAASHVEAVQNRAEDGSMSMSA